MLREAKFSIDSLGNVEFAGYTTGEEWNGWAQPYFDFEQASRIVEAHRTAGERAWYDEGQDAFSFEMGDEVDTFPSKFIEGQKLYPVGAGCWIWEELETRPAKAVTL